jgi:tRNA dimethylallyltransferase
MPTFSFLQQICYTRHMAHKPLLVAIVGPTASGKTTLSIDVALACNGEVVSADSRQVYRGLDIGSAKVTTTEMRGVPHHLIDVADPQTTYTGSNYAHDANVAIQGILSRGKLPIVTGGSFFYIQLLRGTMSPAPVPLNETLRQELDTLDSEVLVQKLADLDPTAVTPERIRNRRRLIRAIEIISVLGHLPEPRPIDSDYHWALYGIDIPLDALTERIKERITTRIALGLFDEIAQLHKSAIPWERLESFGLEYTLGSYYLQGKLSETEFIDQLTVKTRQFAKRQYTWLKREPAIVWLPFPADSDTVINAIKNLQQEHESSH